VVVKIPSEGGKTVSPYILLCSFLILNEPKNDPNSAVHPLYVSKKSNYFFNLKHVS